MTEHRPLPEPFHDSTGFPLPLRHLHAEVRSRGGDIVGSSLDWRITHPDPDLPDIRVNINEQGEVLIDAGSDMTMDVFCDEAWQVGSTERHGHISRMSFSGSLKAASAVTSGAMTTAQ